MNTWEERMSQRASARATISEAEEITHDAAEHASGHLHGALSACPCGAETGGMACIVIDDDYQTPDQCSDCGKPSARWGDMKPINDVDRHARGCPAGPRPDLCAGCGKPLFGTIVIGGNGTRHFACEPGVEIWR